MKHSRRKFDTQKHRRMAWLFWICNLAFMVRVTVFSRGRDPSQYAAVDVYAAAQIAIIIITILLLFSTSRSRSFLVLSKKKSVVMLMCYYVLCAASSMWSSFPEFSLYRAVEFLAMFLSVQMAIYFYSNFQKAENDIFILSLIIIFLEMYVILRARGLTFSISAWHTNSYSASAAIMFCYCFGEYLSSDLKRKKVILMYGILFLAALIIGTSTTSYVAALSGVFVILFLSRRIGVMGSGLFIAALVFLYMGGMDAIIEMLAPGKNKETITSMTGRIYLWRQYNAMLQESPLIGHGFAVSSRLAAFYAQSTHNFIYSVFLGTGCIGGLVFAAYIFKFGKEALWNTRRKRKGALGAAGAIVAGLVNSLGLPLVGGQWGVPSFPYACVTGVFIVFVLLPDHLKHNKEPYIKKFKDS